MQRIALRLAAEAGLATGWGTIQLCQHIVCWAVAQATTASMHLSNQRKKRAVEVGSLWYMLRSILQKQGRASITSAHDAGVPVMQEEVCRR